MTESRYCCNNGECDGHMDPLADWERELLGTDITVNPAHMQLLSKENKELLIENMRMEAELDNKPEAPGWHDWELFARTCLYYMDQDMRFLVMRDIPQTYNKVVGNKVVRVVRNIDNTEV